VLAGAPAELTPVAPSATYGWILGDFARRGPGDEKLAEAINGYGTPSLLEK